MTANMANPRVSVLIPLYNTREAHLREAIDSILAQTFADFELLLLDDASTDPEVGRVVRSYRDGRIRFLANPANRGISRTRNRLVKEARGDYLAIMDHDDVSLPTRLEKQVAYLDAHSDVGVVSSWVELFGERNGVERLPVEDADIRLQLVNTCALFHSASMIRRSVLAENSLRYEEEYTPAEDYALWCRLIAHTRFHNLPEPLLRYRFHAGNASTLQKKKIDQAALAVRSFVKMEYPALYNAFLESATHTTKVKLFGFIPFLTIVTRNNRSKCTVFGIPLYRSKWHSRYM